MIPNQPFRPAPESARGRLLEAGVKLVRAHGYAATTVDQLCAEAGVTKGAFFHHFRSKEALGVALADYWSQSTSGFFASAPHHHLETARDRVLAYIDLRIALIAGPVESFSCVAGTMVQDNFLSSEAITRACAASIANNAAALRADIAEAMADHDVTGTTAESLSLFIQTVIQGSFVLAKAEGGAARAQDQLTHLKRYFALLFDQATR